MPDKWQTLEVQEAEDESEEFPDASLAGEAELAAQSRRVRWRHCWVGEMVGRRKDSGEKQESGFKQEFRHGPRSKRLYLNLLQSRHDRSSVGGGRFGDILPRHNNLVPRY